MVRIQSQSYSFTNQTVRQSERVAEPSKTIDLTSINESDNVQIQNFLDSTGDDQQGWQIRVGARTLEITSPQQAAEYLSELQEHIEQGDIATAEMGHVGDPFGATTVRAPYLRIEVLNPGQTGITIGEHDQGDLDYGGDLILGERTHTFTNAQEAEEHVQREGGAFVIIKNQEGQFDVYHLRSNNNTSFGGQAADINAEDITSNYTSLSEDLTQLTGGQEAYISTADNQLMRVAGRTAIPIDNIANQSIAAIELNLSLTDINGVDQRGRNDITGDLSMLMTVNVDEWGSQLLNDPDIVQALGIPEGARITITEDQGKFHFNIQDIFGGWGGDGTLTLEPTDNGFKLHGLGYELEMDGQGHVTTHNTEDLGPVELAKRAAAGELIETIGQNISNHVIYFGKAMAIQQAQPYLEKAGVYLPKNLREIEPGNLSDDDLAAIDQFLERSDITLASNDNGELLIGITTTFDMSSDYDAIIDAEEDHEGADQIVLDLDAQINNDGLEVDGSLRANLRITADEAAGTQATVNDLAFGGRLNISPERIENLRTQLSPPALEFLDTHLGSETAVTADDLREAQVASQNQVPIRDLSTNSWVQPPVITDRDIELIISEMGEYDIQASGNVEIEARIHASGTTDDLGGMDIFADAMLDAEDVSVEIPGNGNYRLELEEAFLGVHSPDNLNVFREEDAILLQASTTANLTGSLYKGDSAFVTLDDASLTGTGSFYTDQAGDMNFFLNGDIHIGEAQYDNYTLRDVNISGNGSVNYHENTGLNIQLDDASASTARGRLDAGSSGTLAFDAQASGSMQFNDAGEFTEAELNGEYINIIGDQGDKHFEVTANGALDISRDPVTGVITIDANAHIEQLIFDDIELNNLELTDTTLTYDPRSGEITLTSSVGAIDFSADLDGERLVVQSNETNTVTLQAQIEDDQNGSVTLAMPEGLHLDKFSYGEYALENIDSNGASLRMSRNGDDTSLSLQPTGESFIATADLVYDGERYPAEIEASGALVLGREQGENGNLYTFSSANGEPVGIDRMKVGDMTLSNARISGTLIYESQVQGEGSDEDPIIRQGQVQFRGHQEGQSVEVTGRLEMDAGDSHYELGIDNLSLAGELNITPDGHIEVEHLNAQADISGDLNGIPLKLVGGVAGNQDTGFDIGLHAGVPNGLVIGGGAEDLKIERGENGELILTAATMGLGGQVGGENLMDTMMSVTSLMGMEEDTATARENVRLLHEAGFTGAINNITLTITPAAASDDTSTEDVDESKPRMHIDASLAGRMGGSGQLRAEPYQLSQNLLRDARISGESREILERHILQQEYEVLGLPEDIEQRLLDEPARRLLRENAFTPEMFEDVETAYEDGRLERYIQSHAARDIPEDVRALIEQAMTDDNYEDLAEELENMADTHSKLLQARTIQQTSGSVFGHTARSIISRSVEVQSNHSVGFESELDFRESLELLGIPNEEIDHLLEQPIVQPEEYGLSAEVSGDLTFDSSSGELNITGGELAMTTGEFEDVLASGIHELARSRDTGRRIQGIGGYPIRFNYERSGIDEQGRVSAHGGATLFGVGVDNLGVGIQDGMLALTPNDRELSSGVGVIDGITNSFDNFGQRATTGTAYRVAERFMGEVPTRAEWRQARDAFTAQYLTENEEASRSEIETAMSRPASEGGLGGTTYREFRQNNGLVQLRRGDDGQNTLLIDTSSLIESRLNPLASQHGASFDLTLGDTDQLLHRENEQDTLTLPYNLTISADARRQEQIEQGTQMILDAEVTSQDMVESALEGAEGFLSSTFNPVDSMIDMVDQGFELIEFGEEQAASGLQQAQQAIQTGVEQMMGTQDQAEELVEDLEDASEQHL